MIFLFDMKQRGDLNTGVMETGLVFRLAGFGRCLKRSVHEYS